MTNAKAQQATLNILLADDDIDDCLFFQGALEKSSLATNLKIVNDGKQLMLLLADTYNLPDVVFLDLNMPRKNGFECLSEIKLSCRLKGLPIVVFSTSNEQEVVNRLYTNGAQYFIRKPAIISSFEKIIHQTLLLIMKENLMQPAREHFELEA